MQLVDYFNGLARYHAWATQRLLDEHLVILADDDWWRDCGLFFKSVHGTVNHLLVTDDIWFSRLAENQSPWTALDAELHAGRDEVCAALAEAVVRWRSWLPSVDPDRFGTDLVYTRGNGEAVCIPFAPTLGHVFNHATHHRGQLCAALTTMGRPAPELDWVRLLQQEENKR